MTNASVFFNLIDVEADLYNCKRSVATWLSMFMFLEYSMYFLDGNGYGL